MRREAPPAHPVIGLTSTPFLFTSGITASPRGLWLRKVDAEGSGGGEDRWGGEVLSSVCRSVPHNGALRGKRAPAPYYAFIGIVYVDFCVVNSPGADLIFHLCNCLPL